jgi:GntR family transcriptional regulator
MSEPVFTSKSKSVAATLEAEIRKGRLPRGTQLQSEQALARRFSVSRNTVRKGLEDLAERGLIATQSGIGSFVTFDSRMIDNRLGWSRALAEVGAPTVTDLLRLEVVREPELAETLNLADDRFVAVDRLRRLSGSGRAISLERSRIPLVAELEGVVDRGLTDGSLSRTLADAGLRPHDGEEWAELIMLGKADAAVLDRRRGAPFLRTRRLTRTAAHQPIEHVVSLLDPSRFRLHLRFSDQ